MVATYLNKHISYLCLSLVGCPLLWHDSDAISRHLNGVCNGHMKNEQQHGLHPHHKKGHPMCHWTHKRQQAMMLSQDDMQDEGSDRHEGGWGASNDEVQGNKGHHVTS